MKKGTMTMKLTNKLTVLAASAMIAGAVIRAADLPDPDGKPADMSKPVQVFILMGQSNMLPMGRVTGDKGSLEKAVKEKKLYPYLVDDQGNWTTREDVRNVQVMEKRGKMNVLKNDWLTVNGCKGIGVEMAIGQYLGNDIAAPVLLLKSCIGNRSLGWDLLPPGSKRYTIDGVTYCGYKDHATADVLPYENFKYTKPINWYAGKQYDDDVANAKTVLKDIQKYYPGAKDYKVAGFFFWQGDKDRYHSVHAMRYETNLVQLIKALRQDFDAPNAPFVCATLGQTDKAAATGNEKLILDAQLAVDGDSGKHPEFKGNVKTFYTHPVSMGGASNGHYDRNAETYMNVGEGMGKAMVELLEKK